MQTKHVTHLSLKRNQKFKNSEKRGERGHCIKVLNENEVRSDYNSINHNQLS